MKKNNLVSIIIPCYNQAQYLEEAVQSAVDQTYPNIEIIIVNDGSLDNTQKMAEGLQKKYLEKIYIVNQGNKGLSEARNSGIREALGKYIVPLDADDKLNEDMVSKYVYKIEKNDTNIIYTGFQGFSISNYSYMWKPFEQTNPPFMPHVVQLLCLKKMYGKLAVGIN